MNERFLSIYPFLILFLSHRFYNGKYNMFLFTIFISTLFRACYSAYSIKQTILNGASLNQKIAVSQSGAIMIAGSQNGSIIIYRMNAGQYVYSQEFNLFQPIKSIYITGDESTIISGRLNSCQIYHLNTGTDRYALSDHKVISMVSSAKMTEDLMYLVVGSFNPGLSIYKNNGANYYNLHQNLTDALDNWDIYLTPNGQHLIVGGSQKLARIYWRNSGNYVLNSTTSTNMSLAQVTLSEDLKVIVAGGPFYTGNIYLFNGTQYILSQEFYLPTDNVSSIFSTPSHSFTSFAGRTNTITMYQRELNDSFTASSVISMPCSQLYGVWFDSSGSIAVASSSVSTYVNFQCHITNCADCSLIYSCSSCSFGYNLHTDGLCYIPGTEPIDTPTNQTDNTTLGNTTLDNTTIIDNTTLDNTTLDNTTIIDNTTLDNTTLDNTTIIDNTTLDNTTLDNTTIIDNTTLDNKTNNSTIPNNNQNQTNQPVINFIPFAKQICVDQLLQDGFCLEYCDKSCSSCNVQKYNCSSCSEFYVKNSQGVCQIESPLLSFGMMVGSVISVVRHSKIKAFILLVDDLWLYQYHKFDYVGVPSIIFESARLIQSKKDEYFSLDKISFIDSIQSQIKKYDSLANKKYLMLQRKDDSLPQNIVSFTFQVIPVTLVGFLCIKGLFRVLFSYKISVYLRAISFYGFLGVSLIQGNIQYFTFLGMRNLTYLFAEDFIDKFYSVFVILFLFPIVMYIPSFYFLLQYFYRKLLKYFLDNLFRISGATWIMMLSYCIRPFLRGCTHSILYNHNIYQLVLLAVIDFLLFVMICGIQLKNSIFKSKICFVFFSVYFLSGIPLNFALLLNVSYSSTNQYMLEITDTMLESILFARLGLSIFSSIFNILELFKLQVDPFEELDQQGQQMEVLFPDDRNLKRNNFSEDHVVPMKPIKQSIKNDKKQEKKNKKTQKQKKLKTKRDKLQKNKINPKL